MSGVFLRNKLFLDNKSDFGNNLHADISVTASFVNSTYNNCNVNYIIMSKDLFYFILTLLQVRMNANKISPKSDIWRYIIIMFV